MMNVLRFFSSFISNDPETKKKGDITPREKKKYKSDAILNYLFVFFL